MNVVLQSRRSFFSYFRTIFCWGLSQSWSSNRFQSYSRELSMFRWSSSSFFIQYAGVWYEVYRHDINEEGYKCTNETLLANPNGTYTVWLQDISQSAGYHSRHGSAEAGIPSEPAGIVMYVDNPSNAFRFCLITYVLIFF